MREFHLVDPLRGLDIPHWIDPDLRLHSTLSGPLVLLVVILEKVGLIKFTVSLRATYTESATSSRGLQDTGEELT